MVASPAFFFPINVENRALSSMLNNKKHNHTAQSCRISPDFSQLGLCWLSIRRYSARFRRIIVNYLHPWMERWK